MGFRIHIGSFVFGIYFAREVDEDDEMFDNPIVSYARH